MSNLVGYAVAHAAIHHVCQSFAVSRDALLSRSRLKCVAWARQVAMALAYETSGLSSTEIGHVFDRDHANVLYAKREVANRVSAYPDTDGAAILEIRKKIENETYG